MNLEKPFGLHHGTPFHIDSIVYKFHCWVLNEQKKLRPYWWKHMSVLLAWRELSKLIGFLIFFTLTFWFSKLQNICEYQERVLPNKRSAVSSVPCTGSIEKCLCHIKELLNLLCLWLWFGEHAEAEINFGGESVGPHKDATGKPATLEH